MVSQIIWKQQLELQDEQNIRLRSPGEILHFGLDPGGSLCVWFTADPGTKMTVKKTLVIVGTGNPYDPEGLKHIGSTMHRGVFVWHLFEKV